MKIDERDERLGKLFDRAIADLPIQVSDPGPLMRRGTRRRVGVIMASVTTVVVFVGAVGFAASQFGTAFDRATPSSGTGRTPLRFLPADGWDSRAHGRGSAPDISAAWTSNQPIDAGDVIPSYPDGSIAALPEDGIFIDAWEFLPREAADPVNPDIPVSYLPLELPNNVTSRWEGSVPGIGRSSLQAQVEGRYLRIDVFYGTTHPSAQLRSEAQAAVSRLMVEPRGGLVSYTDEVDGVALTVLPGWSVSSEPINTWVSSPREIVALATYPLRPGGDAVTDFQLPSNAIEDLGPDDMVIWLNDDGVGPGMPPRPDHFEPSTPCQEWTRLCPEPTGSMSRLGNLPAPDIHGWWFGFRDAGRRFYAFIGMGDRAFADPDRSGQAWAILDSLSFVPA